MTKRFVTAGHQVAIEAGAGTSAGFEDSAYTGAGASVVATGWDADVSVVVRPPGDAQIDALGDGAVVMGLLEPLDAPDRIKHLAARGITAIAFETLPRTTRAQSMDVLSSQATLAGYQAVLEGAVRLPKLLPMMTTAAGTIRPAKVVVLGAGVAGLQAIATARRLGAVVHAFDVRAAAAEQVESLGAKFITLELERQDASTSGGYAKELADDDQTRLLAALTQHLADADIVITAAAIPGRKAPLLVSADAVAAMAPGSVIVDGAATTGGNCELTKPDEVIVVGGVTILGPTDLPARLATDASQMFARNVYELVTHLSDDNGALTLDFEDEITNGVVVAHGGQVTDERVARALEAL